MYLFGSKLIQIDIQITHDEFYIFNFSNPLLNFTLEF